MLNYGMTRLRWLVVWCALGMGTPPNDHAVAITIDDLPYAISGDRPPATAASPYADSINRAIIAALGRRHVPATGFVIQLRAEQLGDTAGLRILKEWTDAGLDLGNHSYSHPDFNQLSVDRIEDEIVRGETAIRPLMARVSKPLQFFRFPFNRTGDTRDKHDRIAAFLSRHGYRVATCTIENEDWVFNTAYVRALARGDTATAARVRSAYLDYTKTEIAYYANLSRQVLGYEPPQVMLLHDNKLNADAIGNVLSLFEQAHYRFVTLQAAQADPAYQTPDTVVTKDGPMWAYRWARSRHVTVNGALETEPPTWVSQY
jgi:peptidoglycan/xylan/chitin deacetylase (PgdA/CDA1 family)